MALVESKIRFGMVVAVDVKNTEVSSKSRATKPKIQD
jgi:hypothetical protein